MDIQVDASQLSALGDVLKLAPAELQGDLARDVAETAAYAQGIAREGAPVFRGNLANGIHVEPVVVSTSENGISVRGGVIATPAYAVVMEEGRRPGQPMPPLGPIERWVELKVKRGEMTLPASATKRRRRSKRSSGDEMADFLREDSAPSREQSKYRGLAFVIARSIGRKGIKGRHFMQAASVKGQAFLNEHVSRTVANWVSRLNGAGR